MEDLNGKVIEPEKILEEGKKKAEETLKDPDKMEKFFNDLEEKMKVIPKVGDKLACVPIMASLVRSYYKKEYQEVPLGSILAIIGALIYFISPIDLIPDAIPVAGYIDDAAVIVCCFKLVESDCEKYDEWRKSQKK